MHALVALLAILLELAVAYPAALQRGIGHPVEWMGALIDRLDRAWNRSEDPPAIRRRAGILTLGVLCGLSLLAAVVLSTLLARLPFGWVGEGILAAAFLAGRQLALAVRDVAGELDAGLRRGRLAVARIVGRDTAELDEAGIARAAVETLAENASDGVIAPLFWLLLFGLPGIVVYKAINTADSMLGHRTERHREFGWASARCDDLVNWIPARLTAGLFCGAAIAFPGADPFRAWRAIWRDAKRHASPNAGWPEAAMAGALGFGLGGPRAYAGTVLDLPRMGAGRRHLSAADIRTAVRFYWTAMALILGLMAALALIGLFLP